MSQFPLITIGITCFNAEDTIEQAIDSAVEQDYPNTEIIIVDDCSTDASTDIIQKKIIEHSAIKFIQHGKNLGVAGAHNTILENAKGDFIATFDDDDISLPSRLTKQYQSIISYEKEFSEKNIICHTARQQLYGNNQQRYEKTIGTSDGPAPHGKDVVLRILCGHIGKHKENIVGSCANCSRMVRTDILKRLNGYDESFRRGEDTELCVRLALSGGHFVGIEDALVHQKMTHGDDKQICQENNLHKKLIIKHKDFLKNIGWYNFLLLWHDIKYAHLQGKNLVFLKLIIKTMLIHPIKTLQKIIWALPAHSTRKSFKQWHKKDESTK